MLKAVPVICNISLSPHAGPASLLVFVLLCFFVCFLYNFGSWLLVHWIFFCHFSHWFMYWLAASLPNKESLSNVLSSSTKSVRPNSIDCLVYLLLSFKMFQFPLFWKWIGNLTKVLYIISGVSNEFCWSKVWYAWYLMRKLNNLLQAAASLAFRGNICLIHSSKIIKVCVDLHAVSIEMQ